MYGIGIFEIFLVVLVLLLFFRPEDIFGMMRKLGAWFRRIRKVEEDLRRDWDSFTGDTEQFGFDVTDESDEEVRDDVGKQ